jgi:hypothetical protein
MRIFDDPDDVFRTLRMPANDVETRDESLVVDLMVSAHPTSTGDRMTTSTRFASRRARVGALIAAGVIGFGGVAAASPGGLDPFGLGPEQAPVVEDAIVEDTVVLETTPETTVPDDTMQEETVPEEDLPEAVAPEEISVERSAADEGEVVLVEPADTPMFVDNPHTAFNEELCLPGNHGKTVSAVARGEAGFEGIDVRDAAQSDCGKKDLAEADDDGEVDGDEAEQPEATESAAPDTDDDEKKDSKSNGKASSEKPGKPDSPGKSGGKGKNGK